MTQIEAYRLSFEPRYRTTGPKVQKFLSHMEHMSPLERLLLQPQIDDLRHHLDQLETRLHDVTVASETDWEEARHQAETAWGNFQRAINDAHAQMHSPRH